MSVLKVRAITTAIIVMLGAVALFSSLPVPVSAQNTTGGGQTQNPTQPAPQNIASTKTVDSGNHGAADVAARLGITGLNAWIFNAIIVIGTTIAWIGGTLFDISISLFAANMVATINGLSLNIAINEMWIIIRDLFNLLFIFGLVYAGFKIILDANDSASKRNIGTIVIAALLINFSLYASQVIVDFSNVATYQIHQLMAAPTGDAVLGLPVKNISDSFVYLSGIDTLSSEDKKPALLAEVGAQTGESEVNTIGSAILLGLLFCLFYIILGFVFVASAAVLFTRFFTLIILMIFSPMMFLGWVLPGLKSHTNKWWDKFINQALVGPALLFMIYLSLRALQGIGNSGQHGGIMAVMLYLIIVTAFLWASLKVANSLGAYGASQAMSIGKNLGKSARGYAGAAVGGASFGLIGRAGRSTIGRGAQSIAESDRVRDAASQRGLKGWAARRVFNQASRVGDASFDARKVGGMGKKLGLGAGLKGGYKTTTEEIVKRDKEYAKKLGTVSDDDPRMEVLQMDIDATDTAIKAKKAEIIRAKKIPNNEDGVRKAQAELEELEDQQTTQKEEREREKYRRQLGDSSRLPSNYVDDIKNRKGSIKAAQAEYAGILSKKEGDRTDAEKIKLEELRGRLAKEKQELAEVEKGAENITGGYANTVERFGVWARWTTAGDSEQNKNSAKEIRDEFKKKIKSKDKDKPKDKEEKGEKAKGEDKEAS